MKCPSCHQEVPEQSNFCGFCGGRVRPAAAPAAPAEAPAPDPEDALRATLIGGAPAFPPEAVSEDIQATQAMSSLGPDLGGSGDTDLDSALPEGPPAVAAPAPAAPVAPARTPMPSVIIDSAVQREAAALQEAPDTARDLADAAQVLAAALPAPAPAAARAVPAQSAVAANPAAAPAPAAAIPAAAPVAAAQPAAAKPAEAKPIAEAAPAKPAAAKPAAAKAPADAPRKAESQKPAAGQAVPAPGEGGFRETVWFMQSIDPEKLGDIERDDPSAVQDLYQKQKGAKVDDEQRRQFSLNAGASEGGRDAPARSARVQGDTASAGGSRWPVLILVVAVLGGLGAAAWFLFAGS